MSAVTARITTKSQLVLPKEVRQKLGVGPGDTLEFRIDAKGVRIEKAQPQDDPFAAFDEWASAADDEAYRKL
ncbi:MAG: AbrB/MazE/SpoVT family DNA-binding domain-containing protein [Vitreimonas sp.]